MKQLISALDFKSSASKTEINNFETTLLKEAEKDDIYLLDGWLSYPWEFDEETDETTYLSGATPEEMATTYWQSVREEFISSVPPTHIEL